MSCPTKDPGTVPEEPEIQAESAPEEKAEPEKASDNVAEEEEEDPLVIDETGGALAAAKEPVNGSETAPEANNAEEEEDEEEKDFEPTIDMMINEFDDERTLEEEEALAEQNHEETVAEAEALEQEADMPLEELLKMYGYQNQTEASSTDPPSRNDHNDNDGDEEGEGEDENDDEKKEKIKLSPRAGEKRPLDEIMDKSDEMASPVSPVKKSKSELARFYEATVEGRSLRSSGLNQDEEEEEEEEESGDVAVANAGEDEEDGRDYSWKKTIMIGPAYQATVPNGLSHYETHTLPYENEDKLLWDPSTLKAEEIEDFLSKAQETGQIPGVTSLPLGAHVRDDEQALYLLHQCGHNSSEALRRRRMNSHTPAETMSLWSEEECRSFELGLRLYGKDFHMIQQQKVRTRSVGELVQFYYLWKKTERHDVFANATRMEKKKYTLHPGTTDYMDRFIDEQDPSRDLTSPPNYHSLLYGSEGRRNQGLSLNPANNNQNNGSSSSNLGNVKSDRSGELLNNSVSATNGDTISSASNASAVTSVGRTTPSTPVVLTASTNSSTEQTSTPSTT